MTVLFLGVMAASCASLIGLGDYASAAAQLCEKLVGCDGAERYPACQSWLAGRLEGASAADRSGWLTYFADAACTESCANARQCLDAVPLCGDSGDGCGQTEHCCGFIVGKAKCGETASCCKPKGSDCLEDRECCDGKKCEAISPIKRTCGRIECVPVGQACEHGGECCSENCDGNGLCSVICLEDDSACTKPEDCCSKQCDDSGHCSCEAVGGMCDTPEECCSEVCNEGVCESSEDCFQTGEACNVTSDCCPPNDCPASQCCLENGQACNNADQCCNGNCSETGCCSNIGGPCKEPAECCQGTCVSEICGCAPLGEQCGKASDCCDAATAECYLGACTGCQKQDCHSVCKSGGPLGVNNGGTELCAVTLLAQDCIKEVCNALPYCCCITWDDACIKKAGELGKEKGLCKAVGCNDSIPGGT